MKSSVHIPILDALRSIAALSVCFFHLVCTVTDFITSEIILQIFAYGKHGVQMFFVISGMVIPWSLYHANYKFENYPKFLIKRFIRLEPAYLVMVLVAIIFAYMRTFSPYYNGIDITPILKQTLLHIGYLIPFFTEERWLNEVFWTLAIEFQYYISIGILFLMINHKILAVRWLAYFILIGVSFIGNKSFFLYWIPVFMIGLLLFLHKVQKIKLAEFIVMIVVFGSLIILNINMITFIVSMITMALIMFCFNYSNKIFIFFGNISYSIYLVHAVVGAGVVNFFSHIVTQPLLKLVVVVLGVIVTIISAYLLYRFVEKPSKAVSSMLSFNEARIYEKKGFKKIILNTLFK